MTTYKASCVIVAQNMPKWPFGNNKLKLNFLGTNSTLKL